MFSSFSLPDIRATLDSQPRCCLGAGRGLRVYARQVIHATRNLFSKSWRHVEEILQGPRRRRVFLALDTDTNSVHSNNAANAPGRSTQRSTQPIWTQYFGMYMNGTSGSIQAEYSAALSALAHYVQAGRIVHILHVVIFSPYGSSALPR